MEKFILDNPYISEKIETNIRIETRNTIETYK